MAPTNRSTTLAASLDALCVVAFVAIGRRNHEESSAVAGTLATAGPFLIALIIAWAVIRAWHRPIDVRTGLAIWPIVVVVGMLVRRVVFGDGTAMAFVIVATVFLGVTLIGWRALALLVTRRRSASPANA